MITYFRHKPMSRQTWHIQPSTQSHRVWTMYPYEIRGQARAHIPGNTSPSGSLGPSMVYDTTANKAGVEGRSVGPARRAAPRASRKRGCSRDPAAPRRPLRRRVRRGATEAGPPPDLAGGQGTQGTELGIPRRSVGRGAGTLRACAAFVWTV